MFFSFSLISIIHIHIHTHTFKYTHTYAHKHTYLYKDYSILFLTAGGGQWSKQQLFLHQVLETSFLPDRTVAKGYTACIKSTQKRIDGTCMIMPKIKQYCSSRAASQGAVVGLLSMPRVASGTTVSSYGSPWLTVRCTQTLL